MVVSILNMVKGGVLGNDTIGFAKGYGQFEESIICKGFERVSKNN